MHGIHDGGDHWIVVGRVIALHVAEGEVAPLVFYGGRYVSDWTGMMTGRWVIGVLAAAAAAGCTSPAPAGAGGALFKPVATVGQVMAAIVIPSSQALFDSVVYVNGELTQSPKTDDEWFRLRMQALAVAEAGNLLLMPPRTRDSGDWVRMAQAMTEAAVRVEQAADARNIDLMLTTGGELYNACTNCHEHISWNSRSRGEAACSKVSIDSSISSGREPPA